MSQQQHQPRQQPASGHQQRNGGGQYAEQTRMYTEKYSWLDDMISPNEQIIEVQHPHIIIYMIQILTGIGLIAGGIYITFFGIPQVNQLVDLDLGWYPLIISLIGVFVILFELYKRSRTFYVLTNDKFLERHRIIAQRKNPIKYNRMANANTYQSKFDVFASKLLPKSKLGHIKISTAEDANAQLVYPGVKNMPKIESILEYFMSNGGQMGHTTGVYDDTPAPSGNGRGQYPDQNGGQYPEQSRGGQQPQGTNQQPQQPQQSQQPQQNQQNQQQRQPPERNTNQNFNRPQQDSQQNFNRGGGNGGNGNGNANMGGGQYPDQQTQSHQDMPEQPQPDYPTPDEGVEIDDDLSGESRSMFDDVDEDDDDNEMTDPPDRYKDDGESSTDDPSEPW